MDETFEGYVTVKEAAKGMPGGAVTGSHVRALLKDGRLQGKKVGDVWLVSRESLERYEPSGRGRKRTGGVEIEI